MKKQIIIALTICIALVAAPVFAQGRGAGAGQGKGAGAAGTHIPAGHDTSSDTKGQKGSTDSATTTGKSHDQVTIASKIESNDKLNARVSALLPQGTSLTDAAAGFKNQGQFIAALHVSQNLNIPFDQLKLKMTGPDKMSLGDSVHALRPELTADQTKTEVKKAEAQAKTTATVTTTSTKKN